MTLLSSPLSIVSHFAGTLGHDVVSWAMELPNLGRCRSTCVASHKLLNSRRRLACVRLHTCTRTQHNGPTTQRSEAPLVGRTRSLCR